MQEEKIGIALRSRIISPNEIVKISKVVDQSSFTHIFVNESSQEFECLDICASTLGVTKGISVGSGVIRLLEHDEELLQRRLQTLQNISGDRFVLGVGTGRARENPVQSIEHMLRRLDALRTNWKVSAFPKIFIGTLRSGIARMVAGRSDGILLNFCSPSHAKEVLTEYKTKADGTEFACYLKVFFSHNETIARKLLVQEFQHYSNNPPYNKMFQSDGVLEDVQRASPEEIPESLLRISLVNPEVSELKEYISGFRNAGITLPLVYPYFSSEDNYNFRLETIRKIISAAE